MAINIIPIAIMVGGAAYFMSKKKAKSSGVAGDYEVVKNGMKLFVVSGHCVGLEVIDVNQFMNLGKQFAASYFKNNKAPSPVTRAFAENYLSSLIKSVFTNCKLPPAGGTFSILINGDNTTWSQNVDTLYNLFKFMESNNDSLLPPGSSKNSNLGRLAFESLLAAAIS